MVSRSTDHSVSAKTLRQWCAPEVILVVTNLVDELVLMPQVINQARYNRAKIVLAHVVTPEEWKPLCRKPDRSNCRIQEARAILDRMARQLRWLGFTCEPLVLSGRPEVGIPSLARSCCVDRVVVGFEDNPDLTTGNKPALAELLLPLMEVPTCVIGRLASFSRNMFTRSITLAISQDSECDVQLGFASRLAQELHARLTLLHVFNRKDEDESPQTAEAFVSWLPSPTWREAELFCPAEIRVREGDPADEILKYCASTNQDLLILCSPGATPGHSWRTSASYRVLSGAQCPVIVLGKQAGFVDIIGSDAMAPEKLCAYGESPAESFRNEAGI
jgi:nucleotide-binding universal stress UspA family protein